MHHIQRKEEEVKCYVEDKGRMEGHEEGIKRQQQQFDELVCVMSNEGEEKICERMKKHEGRAINCFPMMVSLETAEEREKYCEQKKT